MADDEESEDEPAVALGEGTPDGPRELADVLGDVDQPYFATRQEFLDAVEEAIGTGPVPTAEES